LVGTGYKVNPDGSLEAIAEQECLWIAARHGRFQYIILPGGQHTEVKVPKGEALHSIGYVMAERLVALGVPRAKLITPEMINDGFCLDGAILGQQYIYARDLIEEFAWQVLMLERLGCTDPYQVNLSIVYANFMDWRVRLLYRIRRRKGVHYEKFSCFQVGRLIAEAIALALTLFFPLGGGPLFKKMRQGRTFQTAPPGQTLIPIPKDLWSKKPTG